MSLRTRWLSLSALIVVGCPAPVPPPPPGEATPPTRILPEFITDNREGCVDRIDGDGDGVFEEERHVFLDDAKRIIRRTQRVEGVGLFDEVLLRLDVDGEIHDDEHFSTGADFVPQRFGNRHAFYEAGHLAREVFEGSDGRFLLANVFYTYSGDDLVLIDSVSVDERNFRSSTVEFDYADGQLVETRTDADKNGVEKTVRFERITADDGSFTVTATTEDATGTHVAVSGFDTFGVQLSGEFDDDGDGTNDRRLVADIQGGVIVGYDFDFDGDGVFEARQDYDVDPEALTLSIISRENGVIAQRKDSEFACFSAVVDRGSCDAPFVASEAFGCSRFRFAPAMDRARGSAFISVLDRSFVAAGGFSSFTLGPVQRIIDVVDVDGIDTTSNDLFGELGLAAGVADDDGSVTLFGGILNGIVGTDVVVIDATGATAAAAPLARARYGGQAVRLDDGTVLLVGGQGADFSTLQEAEHRLAGGGVDLPPTNVAPFGGTLTPFNGGAIYIGGDDGAAVRTPSDLIDFIGRRRDQLPQARTAHAAVGLDDTVLVIGGRDDQGVTATVLVISEVVDAISVVDGVDLPLALASVAAVRLPDGRVFVAGGFDVAEEPSAATFVLADGRWLDGPDLQIPRGNARAVVLGDGRIAVIGGSLRTGNASSAVEILELP